MKTKSFDTTEKYIVPLTDRSHMCRKLGGLLAVGILGSMAVSHSASAALTQATIYETPASGPAGGLWLNDASGGHLWISDHISGFCRVDPDPTTPGNNVINQASCYNFGLGGAAGQPAFDPITNFVYIPDLSAKSNGITRLQFDPTTGTVFPDAIVAPFAGLSGDRPMAVALGPDGNLYVSFKKNGNIIKITNPDCVDTATIDCAAIQQKLSVGKSSTGKLVLSLAFAGNDLYLAESNIVTRIRNATLTKAAVAIQAINVFSPQSLAYDGQYLYVGNTSDVWRSTLIPGGNPSLPVSYATGFSFVTGLVIQKATPTSPAGALYAGDDPTNGAAANTGRWWTMPAL